MAITNNDIKSLSELTLEDLFRSRVESEIRKKFEEMSKPVIDECVRIAAAGLEIAILKHYDICKDSVAFQLKINDKVEKYGS